MDQPLDASWMDSRVDLLDLLAQEGEYAFETSANIASVVTIQDNSPEDDAIKVLQDMAEETSQMLAAGTSNDSALDQAVVAQAADTLQSMVEVEGEPTSVDHLLDLLATGMDPPVADINPTVGDMQMQMDSDILTSVTAEDVESILSSEPSSPAAPIQHSSAYNDLPPEKSNSLLAMYLIGDLGTTATSQVSQSPSFDISDLDSMASDVQSDDDDSDYVPSSSYHVSKTRSSPYAKSKAKRGTKSKATAMDKEARALDKKLRKKQQNKDAATRYRQKKRQEADLIDKECDELEARNDMLKDKVDQMTREIGYLKNLLAEVYKARGLIAPKKLGK